MAILAIDGGGTKTIGILSKTDGIILRMEHGGSSNMNGQRDQAIEEVGLVVRKLMAFANEQQEEIEALFAGMAGIEQGSNRQILERYLRELCPSNVVIKLDNDAITALFSGTLGKAGIVQIAGTGSITFGLGADGKRERVGGWGYIVGDPGSGFAIGKSALTAVMRAWDGIDGSTLLTSLVQEVYALKRVPDIIPYIYEKDTRQRVASLVPLVMEAVDRGDATAKRILSEAVHELAEAIECLYHKLYEEGSQNRHASVPVVLTGGVFNRSDLLVPVLIEQCTSRKLQVKVILPDMPPIAGALFAALRLAGVEPDERTVAHMKRELAAWQL